jgi:hypothetical protein
MQPYDSLRADFPLLTVFEHTSPGTVRYNCHAWGADHDDRWYEPPPQPGVPWVLPSWVRRFWPLGVSPMPTIDNFREVFALEGFSDCVDGDLTSGMEKIAIFAKIPWATHTARQLPCGRWTSKLGRNIDIVHEVPQVLEGPAYGAVSCFMERGAQARNVPTGGVTVRLNPGTGVFEAV